MNRPTRTVRLGPRDVLVERRRDGTVLLRSPHRVPRNTEVLFKGSINQRAVLSRRAALVDELYRSPPSEKVLWI
jgi:hypothetical protein